MKRKKKSNKKLPSKDTDQWLEAFRQHIQEHKELLDKEWAEFNSPFNQLRRLIKDNRCPACTGIGSIHQNCILR